MNRRSFFSVLAALPILPLAAKVAEAKEAPTDAVMRDVAFQREAAWRKKMGLPAPKQESFLQTAEQVNAIFPIWEKRMKGLKRTMDAKTRCYGVVNGNVTWWIPLTLIKAYWPEIRSFGIWWQTLPTA